MGLIQKIIYKFWIVIQKIPYKFWISPIFRLNFAPLAMRQDVGALWENFFISERIKANHYSRNYAQTNFWRTTAQQEIDFVEEKDGVFTTFEMKWNHKKATRKVPKAFAEAYPVAGSYVVTPDDYLQWL